ncbi:hypothetical protein [Sphingobacterium hotanense]|uniref:hypothetical protein n=1 Tax=Sphingobacterium hotanense TaxID=649196 RepID=UPI0021A8301F|nr:hypothetical protein [Sphingobacterium hotanense]MCT1526460.1 hypothetical protein [Sphingobacterium hotanense]
MFLKKPIILTLLMTLFLVDSPNAISQELPKVLHPSPQSVELNKFVEFPVDLSVGLPEIKIPLYNLSIEGVDVPIEIRYHASGIKAGQTDGNFGLGWSLSCDYRISRTINGLADSKDFEMPSWQNIQYTINTTENYLLQKYLNRFHYQTPGSVNEDQDMPDRSGGVLDGEFDDFYYSFPNHSGKFIFPSRNSGTIGNGFPIPYNGIRFEPLEGLGSDGVASGILGFVVKDENGGKYYFGESIDKLGGKVLEKNSNPLNARDVTAWALTDVENRYGKKIKFNYRNALSTTKHYPQYTLRVTPPRPQSYDVWTYYEESESHTETYSVFALESITTDKVKVVFNDETGPVTGANKKVKSIEILNSENGSRIRKIEFFYSTIYTSPTFYSFLDSVKVEGSSFLDPETYRFEYYEKNMLFENSQGIVNKYLVPDLWGYVKVASSSITGLLDRRLGNDYASYEGSPHLPPAMGTNTLAQYKSYAFSERTDNNSPWIFSLKSVEYPTGGLTKFVYEQNKVSALSGIPQYSGGIRIKSIEKYLDKEPLSRSVLKREFIYGKDNDGEGVKYNDLTEDDFRQEHPILALNSGLPYPFRSILYSSKPLGELKSTTFYPYVTEKLIGQGSQFSSVLYEYWAMSQNSFSALPVPMVTQSDYHFIGGGPKYMVESNEWDTPRPKSIKYLDQFGNLKKQEVFHYSRVFNTFFRGLKVRPYVSSQYTYGEPLYDDPSPATSYFKYGFYDVNSSNNLLSRKDEYYYFGGDSIVNRNDYYYNEFLQQNRIVKYTSDGKITEIKKYYPVDLTDEVISGLMQSQRDLHYLLMEEKFINGILVSKLENKYQMKNNLFLLDTIKTYDRDSNVMKDAVVFQKYDDNGNILSVSKNSESPHCYLWSYKNSLPIAEIRGISYEQIESVLGLANIEAFSENSSPTQVEISDFLAPLSNSSLTKGKFFAKIFAYDVIYGLKASINEKGTIEEFDYDSFGRLNVEKFDGTIMKTYEYHYR